jgi:hypothetical protein
MKLKVRHSSPNLSTHTFDRLAANAHLSPPLDNPKEIAVLGMLFQLTAEPSSSSSFGPSAIFSAVLSAISSIPSPGSTTELPPSSENPAFDPVPLATAIQSMSFYAYSGSLTTPPCAEGVTFLIATEPLPMGVETYNSMKKVVKFNARFGQNGLGEQNLLEVSKLGLERMDAKEWRLPEGMDVVPMPEEMESGKMAMAGEGEEGGQQQKQQQMKKVVLVVHSPKAFTA